MSTILKSAAIAALFSTSFAIAPAFAGEGHGDGAAAGKPGKASQATTTIEVIMYDNYYEPENISVKEGETVRFIIKNAGELVHEFNIGTAEQHEAHAPMMQMMVEHGVLEADKINHDVAKVMQASMGHGAHDEPNSALLEPGKSAEIVWTFPAHAEIEFACNVPGHYDGGMVGEVELSH
jgi:uncharacterized cupredoxin-like copper-binding protein